MSRTLRKKQKGGIIIDKSKDPETSFYDFISNSTISYLTNGANGLIFKAIIKPGYVSDYRYIDPSLYNRPVTELILKLSLMKVFDPNDYDHEDIEDMNEFDKDEIGNFKNEINKQTDIFLRSMEFLQPLCPAIVFSRILEDSASKELFINTLKRIDRSIGGQKITYNGRDIKINNPLIINDNDLKLGVIAMECATGYNTLFHNIYSKVSRKIKIDCINYALFIVLKLALDLGYSHGDFHNGNIMINNGLQYFEGIPGRPIIIDFGYTTKIPKPDMDIIKEYVTNGEYIRALKHICQVDRADETKLNTPAWNEYYGWICGDWDIISNTKSTTPIGEDEIKYTTNQRLHELFQRREAYVDIVVEQFNDLHARDPALYPLLPLSSAAKNQMYEGILSGGKKRKNKYLRKKRITRRKN